MSKIGKFDIKYAGHKYFNKLKFNFFLFLDKYIGYLCPLKITILEN